MQRRRRTPPNRIKPESKDVPADYDWTKDLPPAPPLEWATVQQVIAGFWRLKLALSDYYNGRGEPMFAKDKSGEWQQLFKVRLDRGVPYGELQDGSTLVLRHVRVGKPPQS